MISILRQRNFGLLWFGQVISVAGDWVLFASLAFYVYALTGSVLASGAMMIVSTVPRVVLGSVAGVFVDRWDRRGTMIAADLGRALVLLPLLAVHTAGDMWIVYLAAFAEAAISQFFGPAKNALVPRIVTSEQLVRANSANSVGEQVGRLVGPAVGGFMLARFGVQSVVAFDVLSFVVSAAMIALMEATCGRTPAATTHASAGAASPEAVQAAPGTVEGAPSGGLQGAATRAAPYRSGRKLLAELRLMLNRVLTALFLSGRSPASVGPARRAHRAVGQLRAGGHLLDVRLDDDHGRQQHHGAIHESSAGRALAGATARGARRAGGA